MWQWNKPVPAAAPNVTNAPINDAYLSGSRTYELSNHLGNVLATISDKKIGVASHANSSLTGHFVADITSSQDYYPFGMLMPGRRGTQVEGGWAEGSTSMGSTLPQSLSVESRVASTTEYKATQSIQFEEGFASFTDDSFTAEITTDEGNGGGNSGGPVHAAGGYRYGFNGKENDNEIKGEGRFQDYGMRIYDPRLGKFLSVDPLTKEYPWNSTYAFAEDDPINFIDLDGLEQARPPRPGSGQGGGRVVPHWRFQAEGAARSLIRGRQQQQREELFQHIRRLNNDPQYRANQQFSGGLIQNQQTNSYWQNAFNSASIALTGGNVQQNRTIGDAWDQFVNRSMIANPNYVGVARQVSLKVTGMINGQMVVANIRMDNVGVRLNPVSGKLIFDLKEAKYSIDQITINNVIQTLTPQQKQAANILISGTNVQISIRGNGSTAAMNAALRGTGQTVTNGQNITGQIGGISIVVPNQTTTNSNGANTTNSNSMPQKKP